MPYEIPEELPARVRSRLPRHAQEIYLVAFNSAWQGYADLAKHCSNKSRNKSREETARRVAWAAVKRRYRKYPNIDMWEVNLVGHPH